jgi:hypothetical protein
MLAAGVLLKKWGVEKSVTGVGAVRSETCESVFARERLERSDDEGVAVLAWLLWAMARHRLATDVGMDRQIHG